MTRQEIITSLENKLKMKVKKGLFEQEIADIYLTNFIVELDKKYNYETSCDTLKDNEVEKIILNDKLSFSWGCNLNVDIYKKRSTNYYYVSNYRSGIIYLNCNDKCLKCQERQAHKIKQNQIEQNQLECLHDGEFNIKSIAFKTYLNCANCEKQVLELYTDTIQKTLFKKYKSEVIAIIKEKGNEVE